MFNFNKNYYVKEFEKLSSIVKTQKNSILKNVYEKLKRSEKIKDIKFREDDCVIDFVFKDLKFCIFIKENDLTVDRKYDFCVGPSILVYNSFYYENFINDEEVLKIIEEYLENNYMASKIYHTVQGPYSGIEKDIYDYPYEMEKSLLNFLFILKDIESFELKHNELTVIFDYNKYRYKCLCFLFY